MSASKISDNITQYTFGGVNFYSVTAGESHVMIGCAPENYGKEFADAARGADAVILLTSKLEYAAGLNVLINCRPDVVVYASPAGLRNIKEIVNADVNGFVIKEGMRCPLIPELVFFVTPGISWVDTVTVSYNEILFSGELFSGNDTEQGFDGFYKETLAVNKGFVKTAAARLANKNIRLICPARGSVIVKSDVPSAMEKYILWSEQRIKENKKALVLYASRSGFTEFLARKAAARLEKEYEVSLVNAYEEQIREVSEKIDEADILLVGTHTINRNAPREIWNAVTGIDLINKREMEYLVFGSYAWAGDGIKLVDSALASMGMKRVSKPVEALFKPSADDVEKLFAAVDKFLNNK